MHFRRVALVFCVLVGSIAVARPSSATSSAPRLTSMSAPTPREAGPGQTVGLNFSASEPITGAGITQVAFVFARSTQQWPPVALAWHLDNSHETTVAGRATVQIDPRAATGRYELVEVSIYDRAGTWTRYNGPDFVQTSDGSTPPPGSDVDWTQYIDVTNPVGDSTPPQLTSLRVLHDKVRAGQPVIDLYKARLDASGIKDVAIYYMSPRDTQFVVRSIEGVAAVGPAATVVPLAQYGGKYRSYAASVTDGAGNMTNYDRDYNGGAQDGGLDFSAADFRVVPFAEDATLPVLKSVSLLSHRRAEPTDQLALDYRASDEGTGVKYFWADWMDRHNHHLEVDKQCHHPSTGPAASEIPDYASGSYKLRRIELIDRLGNMATYWRDGTISNEPADGIGAKHHHFDFSELDITVTDGPGGRQVAPGIIGGLCPHVPTVGLTTSATALVVGDVLTLRGRVKNASKKVPHPFVALYQRTDDGRLRLLGVRRGDADGRYHKQLTPRKSAKYWTTFLGTERRIKTSAGSSKRHEVRVESS